jgi:hypothetical protein
MNTKCNIVAIINEKKLLTKLLGAIPMNNFTITYNPEKGMISVNNQSNFNKA